MKINSKLIQVCNCPDKYSHAYCTTADILRRQKIFCRDCQSYYRLYVKSERIISTEYLGSIVKLLFAFMVLGICIYGIYEFDKILKTNAAYQDVESGLKSGEFSYENYTATMKKALIEKGEDDVDQRINITITQDNKIIVEVDNTFLLAPCLGVLFIILIWCFYLHFVLAFMKRRRLVWVEVQDS